VGDSDLSGSCSVSLVCHYRGVLVRFRRVHILDVERTVGPPYQTEGLVRS
jgi:hypothetical protein